MIGERQMEGPTQLMTDSKPPRAPEPMHFRFGVFIETEVEDYVEAARHQTAFRRLQEMILAEYPGAVLVAKQLRPNRKKDASRSSDRVRKSAIASAYEKL